MSDEVGAPPTAGANAHVWRAIFHEGHPDLKRLQSRWGKFPSPPHCVLCYAPFGGVGGALMWLTGRRPNGRNPRYCNKCDEYLRDYPGGAYAEVSMLYADIRGSTALAERMSGAEYSKLVNGFYNAVARALIETDGFVFERQGDAVFGVYPRGFCGKEHASKAIEGARRLLTDIRPRTPDGSLLPFGMGVHSGEVFIATMGGGDEGKDDHTARDIGMPGDKTTVAARLSKVARGGEALITDAAYQASDRSLANAERRPQLKLEGRSEPVDVWVLRSS
jgi:adenylate cyclase